MEKNVESQYISNMKFLQKLNDKVTELEKEFLTFKGDLRLEVSTSMGKLENKIDSLISKLEGKNKSKAALWAAVAGISAVASVVVSLIAFSLGGSP